MTVRILRGDCRDMLKTLPAESVHCCVTSPPYWGLRDYGIPPSIWGGDPACAHEWGPEGKKGGGSHTHTTGTGQNGTKQIAAHEAISSASTGNFCSCGAWRGCLGLEPTPELFVAHMVEVFREVRRVLRPDGTLWLNLGDSYATGGGKQVDDWDGDRLRHRDERRRDHGRPAHNGRGEPQKVLTTVPSVDVKAGYRGDRNGHEGKHGYGTGEGGSVGPAIQPNRMPIAGLKPKDMVMIPERVVLAMQADGWWVRSRMPWLKRNSMPESVTDRPANATEYVFLLSKSERYFYDREAVKMPASPGMHERYAQAKGQPFGMTNWERGDGVHEAIDLSAKRDRQAYPGNGVGFGHGTDAKARGRKRVVTTHKIAAPNSRIKNNESFDQAMRDMRPTRNRRNSDWFFESWQGMVTDEDGEPLAIVVNPAPFSEAHFATFPPKLIEPMIKAGTSEHGCCHLCKAPWVRTVDVEYENVGNRAGNGPRSVERKGQEFGTAGFEKRLERRSSTKGWEPTCDCNTDAVMPCTVLDPFGGAATTGLVADRLRRHAILTELKPEYADIGEKRIYGDAPLFASVTA